MTTLADRLREARKLRGIKGTALDALAGLSQGTTSRYEAGKRGAGTNAATVAKFAGALRVREEWLLRGDGPMDIGPSGSTGLAVLRDHPRWAELCEEARGIRRGLTTEDFDRVAPSPWLFGPIEDVDAVVLADLASNIADWAARSGPRSRR